MDELALQAPVLGDVAEAPDPPDDLAADALRERVALEDAAVLELERVVALRLGIGVELLHLGDEGPGIAELIEHERQRVVVARLERLGREPPHLDEAAVEARDGAGAVDDEDPVGGRLEGRREHRVRRAQVFFRDHAVGDVVPGRDEPFDRRVVEQVRERERERNRFARGVAQAQVDGNRRRSRSRPFDVRTSRSAASSTAWSRSSTRSSSGRPSSHS